MVPHVCNIAHALACTRPEMKFNVLLNYLKMYVDVCLAIGLMLIIDFLACQYVYKIRYTGILFTASNRPYVLRPLHTPTPSAFVPLK